MTASSFHPALSAAFDHALDHLASLGTGPVAATASLDELRQRIDLPLNQAGLDPVQVVSELVAGVEGGLLGSAGGRFFGWGSAALSPPRLPPTGSPPPGTRPPRSTPPLPLPP